MKKLLTLFLLLVAFGTHANTPTPTIVKIAAHDGLTLAGDWYLQAPQGATVILLHQLYANRTRWAGLDTALLAAGYNVLAVDLRGYGETGGRIQWREAIRDIATWQAWLTDVAGIPAGNIALVGSSMGSVLAIVGCGNAPACPTAIAISPGWEYFGVGVRGALAQLEGREVLALYATRDRFPALGVPRMHETAPEVVTIATYTGNAHGIDLITKERETLIPQVLAWLARFSGK